MRFERTVLCLALCFAGCAFPRRSAPTCPADARAQNSIPEDIWRLELGRVNVPTRQRGDLAWDEDGSPPDVFVRIYRDDVLLFESEAKEGVSIELGVVTPNLFLPRASETRVELWDQDAVVPSIIGIWRGAGIPSQALSGGDAGIVFDGAATLAFRPQAPIAQRGLGVSQYEVHAEFLRVLTVHPRSPASRAGVTAGDEIYAINGTSIRDLGEQRAASELALACTRSTRLTLQSAESGVREVQVDGGYIWPAE